MDLNNYQNLANRTAVYPTEKGLEYTALGLAGEAGEYAGKVSKLLRGDVDKDDFDYMAAGYELGDVLWFVAIAAKELGLSLGRVAEMNLSKLQERAINNAIHGNGDYR